jgi:hypothetical protein
MPPMHSSSVVTGRSSQPVLSQFQDQNVVSSRGRAMSEVFGPPLPNCQIPSASQNSVGFRHESGQVRRATSAYGDVMAQRFDTNGQPDRRTSLVPEFLRPLSAPVAENPESFSQWLPPRRELPFAKARVTPKPLTPTTDPPPSPRLKATSHEPRTSEIAQHAAPENITPVLDRDLKRVAHRQNNGLPTVIQANMSEVTEESLEVAAQNTRQQVISEREEEPSPLAAKSAAVTRPTAPGLQSKVMNPVTRKRPSETEPDVVPASKQARRMVDRATQTQTLSGRDHTIPLTLATGIERSHSAVHADTIEQPPETFMKEIETFVSRHKHRPPPVEIWQRPGYIEASPEERQAIINDFICENLENEDFIKLCEDTGEVWRRIGLEI